MFLNQRFPIKVPGSLGFETRFSGFKMRLSKVCMLLDVFFKKEPSFMKAYKCNCSKEHYPANFTTTYQLKLLNVCTAVSILRCSYHADDWWCDCISVLRSEIPSGMCAKLRIVAASNNRDHASQSLLLLLARATLIYFCSLRTSHSWWIIQSTQHHRRGCNKRIVLFECLWRTYVEMRLLFDATEREDFWCSAMHITCLFQCPFQQHIFANLDFHRYFIWKKYRSRLNTRASCTWFWVNLDN